MQYTMKTLSQWRERVEQLVGPFDIFTNDEGQTGEFELLCKKYEINIGGGVNSNGAIKPTSLIIGADSCRLIYSDESVFITDENGNTVTSIRHK